MTGYRQQEPKIGLTKCPDLVDHYNLHFVEQAHNSYELEIQIKLKTI